MNPSRRISYLSAILALSLLPGAEAVRSVKPATPASVGFCEPQVWLFGDSVAPPHLMGVGDLNGDGYADFVYASPKEKSLDAYLNGKGWKTLRSQRIASDLPQEIAGFCLGRFGGAGLGAAVLGVQGRLVKLLNDGSGKLSAPKTLAEIPDAGASPRLVAVRLDPKTGADDLTVVSRDGRVRIYDGASGALIRQFVVPSPATDAAASADGGHASLLAILSGGELRIYRMDGELKPVKTITAPKGQEALALGDVDADGETDALLNGRVFFGPDFRRSLAVPGWDRYKKPVSAALANVIGRGRADLIVQHEGSDYFGSVEADCEVRAVYFKSDSDWDGDGLTNDEEARLHADPLNRDTDGDGLFDGWEAHGFAGIDFPGMGASPLHKDVFVMNLPFDTIPVDPMEKRMREEIVPFYADLPFVNPDGKKGFALHWMTETPALSAKASEGKGWEQLAEETFPKEKIGYYHWMQIGGLGGGGQSNQLADAGSTGMGSWIHEFGHQLGLSHSGKWDAWSPTYTSLMNYSYSYAFDGDPKKVHYSSGELASLVLNESHLPGRVPFPMAKLEFLAGPPYRFHLKSAGKDATFVDWGWTGVFSDKKVRANITYGYSVGGGERLQPSGTQSFHYDGPFELMTDQQASLAEHRGKLYMLTASRPPVDPKAPRPESAKLVMQTYMGHRAWTPPVEIAQKTTGDPCAASDGRLFYVFYPTAEGVMARFGQPDKLGPARLVPDSAGASVSAVNWKGTLRLFLYYGPDREVMRRTVRGEAFGAASGMGFKSSIPPGAAIDTIHDQLLLGTAGALGDQPCRWQLRRFSWDKVADTFKEASCAFVGGEKSGWAGNRRPTLIFNPGEEFGPDGRIYWIATGISQPMTAPTAFYLAQTIGYKDKNDGWLLWRYYDEWTNTHSGIGAAWFDKDIVLATTWASGTAGGDGGVFCAYNGTAVSNVNMGDFDDISLMANYGMARSIGSFAVMPPSGAENPSSPAPSPARGEGTIP